MRNPKTRSLAPEHARQYENDGYVVLSALFEKSELDHAVGLDMKRLLELQKSPDLSSRIEVGKDLQGQPYAIKLDGARKIHDRLIDLANDFRLTRVVSALFDEPALVFKDKLVFKPPAARGFPPHQDMAFGYHRLVTRVVSCMIALDAATVENGCLEVVSGGHREGYLAGAEEEPPLECVSDDKWIPVPLDIGDVLFFDGMLPHRSGNNLTEQPRRVFIVTFSPASEEDHYADYYAWRKEWVAAGFPTHFASSYHWSSKTGLT